MEFDYYGQGGQQQQEEMNMTKIDNNNKRLTTNNNNNKWTKILHNITVKHQDLSVWNIDKAKKCLMQITMSTTL